MREQLVAPQIQLHNRASDVYHVESIHYTIANTPRLINQYYNLVVKMYRKLYCHNFEISAQEHLLNNLYGKIVVALDNHGDVIGGARVIISEPGNRCLLPLESIEFNLKQVLLDYNLNEIAYSEWGRFVILSTIENKAIISENIAKFCVNISLASGCHFQFGLTNDPLKNRIEDLLSKINLKYTQLIPSSDMPRHPLFPKIRLYLGVADLRCLGQSEIAAPLMQDEGLN